jgi:hypothetical protein
MPEFWVPSTEEFGMWHEDHVPVAVVRLVCGNQHYIAEWWRLPDGTCQPWGGIVRPGERGPVQQEGVGFLKGFGETLETAEWVAWPIDPDRSDAQYFRTIIECPDLDCTYRVELAAVDNDDLLLDQRLREVDATTTSLRHESGAPMVVEELNGLLRRASGSG